MCCVTTTNQANDRYGHRLCHVCVTVRLCCLMTIMYANDRCDCTGSFPPDTVPGQSMDWFYGAYLQSWGYWLPYSVAPTIMR